MLLLGFVKPCLSNHPMFYCLLVIVSCSLIYSACLLKYQRSLLLHWASFLHHAIPCSQVRFSCAYVQWCPHYLPPNLTLNFLLDTIDHLSVKFIMRQDGWYWFMPTSGWSRNPLITLKTFSFFLSAFLLPWSFYISRVAASLILVKHGICKSCSLKCTQCLLQLDRTYFALITVLVSNSMMMLIFSFFHLYSFTKTWQNAT